MLVCQNLEYDKIMNMTGLSICERYTTYTRICLDTVLNISWVLNIPGLSIWQGFECESLHRALNMPQYG